MNGAPHCGFFSGNPASTPGLNRCAESPVNGAAERELPCNGCSCLKKALTSQIRLTRASAFAKLLTYCRRLGNLYRSRQNLPLQDERPPPDSCYGEARMLCKSRWVPCDRPCGCRIPQGQTLLGERARRALRLSSSEPVEVRSRRGRSLRNPGPMCRLAAFPSEPRSRFGLPGIS